MWVRRVRKTAPEHEAVASQPYSGAVPCAVVIHGMAAAVRRPLTSAFERILPRTVFGGFAFPVFTVGIRDPANDMTWIAYGHRM